MEKRRRARINQSVDQLQKLISENDSTPKNMKMEKADILEMAVQYLKKMKQRSNNTKECKENCENKIIESYSLGFEKCMEETTNLIMLLPGVDGQMQDRINDHLRACLDNVKNHMTNHLRSRKLKKEDENHCYTQLTEICQNKINKKNTEVTVQEMKNFQMIPSKFMNGDFILIISPNSKENHVIKSKVWRPWW